MSAEPFHEPDIIDAVVAEAERSLLSAESALVRLERVPTELGYLDEIYLCFHALAGNADVCGLGELGQFARRVAQNVAELLTAAVAVSRPQLRLVRQSIELAMALLDGTHDGPAPARTREAFLVRMCEHCALVEGEGETPPDGEALRDLSNGQVDRPAANDGATVGANASTRGNDVAEAPEHDPARRLAAMTRTVRGLIARVQDAADVVPASTCAAELDMEQMERSLVELVAALEGLSGDLRRHARDAGWG